ncbi:beta-ketoacyl-ACP synthase III [Granulicoccus sp. GXG6511]|uniref:beta-ketoacyl-ACP synthase III n=1 Tax=Granulicoccus sp. GXG6511 TaxID=3381351 RepID=UPI003D7C836B
MSATIQSPPGAPFSRIMGIGSYRPVRVVDNAEMCTMIESSDEWIVQRTGISERRWAGEDETIHYMSVQAARQAMERGGVTGEDIDCVIVATVTHMTQFPAIAPQIALELGAQGAPAYDISAACAGFCVGLAQADALVRSGAATNVLVIGVERLTDITNLTDRSTAFLFADGAGAAVVGPSDEPKIGPVVWGADGAAADVLKMTRMWDDETNEEKPTVYMEGQAVFKWASQTVARKTTEMLDKAGLKVEDLDLFVPHQANNRIIDAMMRTLRMPESVTVARDIKRQGNTSAASIPLAIETLYEEGLAKSGQTALIVGFGGGLIFAGQVIVLP